MNDLDPATEKLISQLAKRSQEIQEEDSKVFSVEKRKESFSFWKEVVSVAVVLVTLVGFFYNMRISLDNTRDRLEETRNDSKKKDTEIEASVKELEKDIHVLELDFARYKANNP